jgi:hypothetical protein
METAQLFTMSTKLHEKQPLSAELLCESSSGWQRVQRRDLDSSARPWE